VENDGLSVSQIHEAAAEYRAKTHGEMELLQRNRSRRRKRYCTTYRERQKTERSSQTHSEKMIKILLTEIPVSDVIQLKEME
jgi:hypothetical protein